MIPMLTLPVGDWTRHEGGGPRAWHMLTRAQAEAWQLAVNHWDKFPYTPCTTVETDAIRADSIAMGYA